MNNSKAFLIDFSIGSKIAFSCYFCLLLFKKNPSEFSVEQRAKTNEQRAKGNEQRAKSGKQRATSEKLDINNFIF